MNPNKHTIREFFLDVSGGHKLYVQEWGNAKAEPVIYLHGGPGGGCDDRDYTKFDPTKQRIVFFDQRGAGKSTPRGSLKNNTTDDLINDIELIRKHFGLDKVVLTGGSWGSTLALCYAIKHPGRTKALVIDGVFVSSPDDYKWLEQGGWRFNFPEIWQEFSETVPKDYKNNPAEFFYSQLDSQDAEKVKKAAYGFLAMEIGLLKLDDQLSLDSYEDFDPNAAIIEMHFLKNRCFISDDHILKNAPKLTMPVYIIQGRYDMVCPPMAAYRLHNLLPNSELNWTISGHIKQHESKNILKIQLNRAVKND